MSVIVRTPEDQIVIMTKGADSHIVPRLMNGQQDIITKTHEFLEDFANEGLRTLILA